LCNIGHTTNAITMVPSLQIHQDDLKQNVLLQLLALVAKQPAFHQLRSVEQLGYIALLRQRYGVLSLIMYYARCFGFGDKCFILVATQFCLPRNDSGVRGLQFIIQSTVKVHISSRHNSFHVAIVLC
jgi:insulysin